MRSVTLTWNSLSCILFETKVSSPEIMHYPIRICYTCDCREKKVKYRFDNCAFAIQDSKEKKREYLLN